MTPSLELVRLEELFNCTIGVLKLNKEVLCYTLEESDMLNSQNISSIPAQQYLVARVVSPKFGDTFQIMNVPGRTHVLFHPGNTAKDTEGCVLLGKRVGWIDTQRAVFESGASFEHFKSRLKGINEVRLTIREVY